MRKVLFVLLTTLTTLVVTMSAALACSPRPHLKIDRVTGAIELDDLSPIGGTPPSEQNHVVLVHARLKHCGTDPNLYESGTLTQDGVDYPIGGGGLGQGEVICLDGHADVGALFLGDNHAFHVGRARVHLVITSLTTGAFVAEASRTVYIPADDTGL
jgi:hypothetical protein